MDMINYNELKLNISQCQIDEIGRIQENFCKDTQE